MMKSVSYHIQTQREKMIGILTKGKARSTITTKLPAAQSSPIISRLTNGMGSHYRADLQCHMNGTSFIIFPKIYLAISDFCKYTLSLYFCKMQNFQEEDLHDHT